MSIGPERSEPLNINVQRVSLIEKGNGYLAQEIAIPQDQLRADLWPEMVRLTQADGREKAVRISVRFGRVQTGGIIQGVVESGSSGTTTPEDSGIFRLLSQDIAFVHTHPMPSKLDHLQTTLFSDRDITSFTHAAYKALVMIDRGGVHLLLRDGVGLEQHLPENVDFIKEALKKAKQGNATIAEARKALAVRLRQYGIRYYYSPNLVPTSEGYVQVKDAS